MSANMFSQRAALSLRRLAATHPSTLTKTTPLSRLSAPASIAVGQYRFAATSQTSSDQAIEILAAQRRQRPVAPHLTIYKPQVTWVLSAYNRITGVILSGTFYAFGAAYLAAPVFGWHLESASIAAAFAGLPIAIKLFIKAFYALPFSFHCINAFRHLTWDTGAAFTNKQVIVTGWTVVGLTALATLGLTFY